MVPTPCPPRSILKLRESVARFNRFTETAPLPTSHRPPRKSSLSWGAHSNRSSPSPVPAPPQTDSLALGLDWGGWARSVCAVLMLLLLLSALIRAKSGVTTEWQFCDCGARLQFQSSCSIGGRRWHSPSSSVSLQRTRPSPTRTPRPLPPLTTEQVTSLIKQIRQISEGAPFTPLSLPFLLLPATQSNFRKMHFTYREDNTADPRTGRTTTARTFCR